MIKSARVLYGSLLAGEISETDEGFTDRSQRTIQGNMDEKAGDLFQCLILKPYQVIKKVHLGGQLHFLS